MTTVENDERPPPVSRIGAGLAALVAAPVVITLLYRLLPASVPHWTPFAVLAVALAVLWVGRPRWRAVVVGATAGSIMWAAFLAWLLSRPMFPE